MPWNRDWKEKGDLARRYIGLGKAGRELVRWVRTPLKAFGNKLSPVARTTFEQLTGSDVGGRWEEPWHREDMDLWEETYARFGHLMSNFKPFSFGDNNAFLAFPSRKGMTRWKAFAAYHQIYLAKGRIAAGGVAGALTKAARLLDKDSDKLMADIAEGCVAGQIDSEKARKGALAKARSKFYGKFWRAAKDQDAEGCNQWAKALKVLGATLTTLKGSQRFRRDQLSPEAIRTAEKAVLGVIEPTDEEIRRWAVQVSEGPVLGAKKRAKVAAQREEAIRQLRAHGIGRGEATRRLRAYGNQKLSGHRRRWTQETIAKRRQRLRANWKD